ncbi:DUF58 domain-containing protein [Marispirochaeta aestuarii]|uniref:DUF58 domain-containing protein n=1 Tax=Marispirochaeta aestuarii TaxID=1963862 RepID=UPI0029C6E1DF|nr:DUF58 domain-containing protein [Marispirochaeta aestuarii]
MEKESLFQRIRNLPLVSAKLLEGLFAGNYRSVFRGPGLEFDEVREYSEGDDVRNIDWNVSSRMGSPYAKTFREERELVLSLVFDVSASLDQGVGDISKRDMAMILGAIFAFAAVHNNDRVGGVFFSDRIEKWVPPSKGRKHVASLIEDMENLKPRGAGSELGLALKTVYESLKSRGICVVFSDFRTATGWNEMTLLARKHDVIAVRISDPGDNVLPLKGSLVLQDPERGHSLLAGGVSPAFRSAYGDFWDTQDVVFRRECRRRRIQVLSVDTSDDPVAKVLAFFKTRRRVS